MHRNLPDTRVETRLPSCSHISLSPLSIYFSPRLSPSPPSLNPSRSHLRGSHPSFVLLPPPPPPSPPPVSVCISVCFLSTSAGEKSSPARLILLVFSVALWFRHFYPRPVFFVPLPPPTLSPLHLRRRGPFVSPSVLSPSVFFLSDIPRSISV